MTTANAASAAFVSPRRANLAAWATKCSLQAMALVLATPVFAQSAPGSSSPAQPAPTVNDGGGNTGYVVSTSTTIAGAHVVSGSQNASNAVYTNYQTTGGAGSGGGAGLGGVFFVDKGASLTLNNVSFSGNAATGGTGGGPSISSVTPFQVTVNAASADAATDKVLLPTFNYGVLADGDPRSQYSGGQDTRNALTVDSFTLKTADPNLVKGSTAYLGNIATSAAQDQGSAPAPGAMISDVITNGDGSVTYKLAQTYTAANGTTQTGAYVVPEQWLAVFKLNDGNTGYYGEDNTSDNRASGHIFIPPSQILPGAGLSAREDDGPVVNGTITGIKYGSGSNIVGFSLTAPQGTVYPTTVSAPLFNSLEVPRFKVANQTTNTIATLGPSIPFQVGMLVYGDGIPAGTTITGVTKDPVSQQVSAITLSNNVDLANILSFRAAFSPLLNNDTAKNQSTIQLASVANLGLREMVTGAGIANGATIIAIDQTNNTITISSAIDQTGLTAISNGGFQVTANPVINSGQVDSHNMTYATIASTSGLQVGSELQGAGIPDNARISQISGNQVYYVIDNTFGNLFKGGALNGLTATDLTPSSNGKAGNFGAPLNAIIGDGEGTDGTNGYNGKASATTAGGNGGSGGDGSFGSPVNTQLIVQNTLDALGIGADIAGIIDDAANPFTVPKALSDGIALGVDIAGQVNDLVQLAAYTVQLGLGEAGFGGGGGSGGAGGNGGEFFGGGSGGNGGKGGDGALPITDGGAGGDGGTGGKGGFGAGGGSGGQGGLGGAGGRSDNGGDGSGGVGGFGGGVGSSGYAGGGGGGSGYGGAIFVRTGGTLTISGNALFENNNVLGGSSNDGGQAGQAAGGDLFMMRGSSVTLTPGVGNTITFTDGIGDDSAASIQNASYATGQGAGLTIAGGGLVQFQAANTYTGATIIQGATLEADQGVGLNAYSNLTFAGSGTISTAGSISEANAGVLLTSGRFTRSLGSGATNVQWTGSGGFAATAAGLTVNLGQINGGQGTTLNWGVGAFKPGTLVFGSSAPDATGAVTFMNAINLGGNTGRIAVVDNAGSTADRAIMTGAITGGSLIVNDANYAGALYLDGQNALTGIIVQNGLVSTLDGSTVGHLMASTGGSVAVTGGELLLGGAETLTTVGVSAGGTLDARGAITAGNIGNAGTILLAAPSTTGNIYNTGVFTAAQSVSSADIANSATGIMTFVNGVRSAANAGGATGSITNAGTFTLGGGLNTATNVYNASTAGNVPVFNQYGSLVVANNVVNAGNWALGADLSAKNGTVENDGTMTVFGDTRSGSEVAATRTISAATFTGGTTGQIALGGSGGVANTLVVNQTGTSTYQGTVTGAGKLVVSANRGALTLAGVLSQAGGLEVSTGTVTLTAADTYQGQTLIDPSGTLALTGQGSIGQSALTDNGVFDISGAQASSAAIASLAGRGSVLLGGNTLTLTNAAGASDNPASGTFSGQIGGSGGLIVAGGTELLSGTNSYTGATRIAQNAGLGLVGNGLIASSSAVRADGTFSIAATSNGAMIGTLSGASTGSVLLGGQTLTVGGNGIGDFAGIISGAGSFILASGGQQLDGANTFAGRTIINSGAGLALVGNGSLATSGVTDNGVFMIDNTNAGASIASLSGNGYVGLGAQTLTLTNAADAFAGNIAGSGNLAVAGGIEKLSGQTGYGGATTIAAGATLGLVGTGSIAGSSGVTANGTFAIGETTSGATITTLSGGATGSVALGNQTLTIANGGDFAGVIGGTGSLVTAGGTLLLRGVNTYTGPTVVNGGAALSLVGGSSIAPSSGVTANGVFAIAGAGGPESIASLSGGGIVQLGANTMTLTKAADNFSGMIVGSGGLTVGGGTETLSGQNGYTGQTTIAAGATLGLAGTGTVGTSSSVVDNGVLAIDQTSNGAMIRSLSGTGQVLLGSQRLALTAAADLFGGTIAGGGGLDILAGSETLTGASSYTGTTTIATNTKLALTGSGSIATSAGLLDNGAFDIFGASAGVSIATLAGNGAVTLGGNRLTLINGSSPFGGVIAGTQGITLAGGIEMLSGANTYTGRTQIAQGATLALAGSGSIAASAGVDAAGTLDISNTTAGAAIASLSGKGAVQLGNMALTLSKAADEFDGVIAGAGTLTVAGGTETLSGVNTITGLTTVAQGAQLNLVGDGSIAASVGLLDNGVFSIAGVTGGATLQALFGTGQVVLGSQQLTVAGGTSSFGGSFTGSGAVTFSGGSHTLSGANGYTGRTIIAPNTTLALVGAGSLAASSGVTDNGTFSIAGVSGPSSIMSLSGNGTVALGANALSLTNANDQFAGVIRGAGGLTLAGGSESLSGTNTYTGSTIIAASTTLSLVGSGSIAGSSVVTDNGAFSIDGANTGASITSLSGSGAVALGGNTLTLTAAADRFDGSIAGIGGLTVSGGAETLTAAQRYTGATTVAAGAALVLTGQGSVANSAAVQSNGLLDLSGAAAATLTSLSGLGQVALGANTLTLTNAGNSFGGAIGGTGGLTVAGGTETLTGANAYTGRTTVNGGATLALAGTGSIAGSAGASIGGTLDLTGTTADTALNQLDGAGNVVLGANRLLIGAASGAFAGTISGRGPIAIQGGQMALTGASSYQGGTQVTNAGLTIASDNSLGAAGGTLALQNAMLTFGGATTSSRTTTLTAGNTLNLAGNAVVLNGAIGGSGGLTATGGGTLTLGGSNSYAGGTSVNGSTLRIAGDAALGATTGAVMLQNSTLQATGNVATTRDVIVTGSDRFDGNGYQISLNGTMYGQWGTGYAAIASGGMRLTGVLTVDPTGFTVTQGALLRGTGSFSRATTVAGTLAPGNSPGTMTFNAPVTFTSTGTLSLDIDGTGTGTGAGNYSRVVLTGANAFTAAGTLAPVLRGITGSATNIFTPSLGQTFTVVQTNVAINGTFATIAQPASGLATGTRFDALYGNNVTLVVTPSDYSNLAALLGGNIALTANQQAVGASINALRGNAGSAIDAQTASILTSIYSLKTASDVATLETELAGEVYTDVLRAAAARSNAFGQTVDFQMEAGTRGSGMLWLAGYNRGYDFGSSVDRPTYGMAGGVGLQLGQGGIIGVAGGYDAGRITFRASNDSAEVKMTHVTGYAGFTGDNFFVRGQAGATRTDVSATRSIALLGLTAHGSGSGWGFTGSGEIGYVAKTGDWILQPSISARVARIRLGSIAENGAGPVSLTIGQPVFNEAQGVANLRIGRDIAMTNGWGMIRPVLDIGYLRELDDRTATIVTRFAGAPGAPTTIRSIADGHDALRLGAGLSLAAANGLSVSLRGDLSTQRNIENRSITAGLGWRW